MSVVSTKGREPKLDREVVVETARRIIEAEGLSALTIRRIGVELGVQSSSLYHHFTTKEDIVQEVLSRVMSALQMPQAPMRWTDLLVEICRRYWTVLVKNPHLIPTLAERPVGRFSPEIAREVCDALLGGGVPVNLVYTFTEQTEALTLGSATFAIRHSTDSGDGSARQHLEKSDSVRQAFAARVRSEEERFLVGCRAMVRGFEELVAQLDATATRTHESGSTT